MESSDSPVICYAGKPCRKTAFETGNSMPRLVIDRHVAGGD